MNQTEQFDDLYQDHSQAVYRFCLRAVSRPEIAEDITSEVFLLLHEALPTLDPAQLPGWLFTVARRRAADYWRRHYVEQRWNAEQDPDPAVTPEPEFALEDLLERCAALKGVHRACLVLRFRHEMSRAEIAAQMGLSELQIKGHLQYALQLLRQHMDTHSSADRTFARITPMGGSFGSADA